MDNEQRKNNRFRDRRPGARGRSTAHKLIVTIGGLAIVTLAFCTLTWAIEDGGSDRQCPRSGIGRAWIGGEPLPGRAMLSALDRHLGLDDQQRETIAQILDESRDRGESLWAEIEPTLEAVRMQIEQGGYDEAEIRRLLQDQSPRMIDLMLLRLGTIAGIREQLTPDQQQAAGKFLDSRRGRFMRHGRGRGQPDGDPPAFAH